MGSLTGPLLPVSHSSHVPLGTIVLVVVKLRFDQAEVSASESDPCPGHFCYSEVAHDD